MVALLVLLAWVGAMVIGLLGLCIIVLSSRAIDSMNTLATVRRHKPQDVEIPMTANIIRAIMEAQGLDPDDEPEEHGGHYL